MLEYWVLALLTGLPLYFVLRQHSYMDKDDCESVAIAFGLAHKWAVELFSPVLSFTTFFNWFLIYGVYWLS